MFDQYDSYSFFTLKTQIPKIQTKINLHVNWSVELSKRYANKYKTDIFGLFQNPIRESGRKNRKFLKNQFFQNFLKKKFFHQFKVVLC